MVKNKNKGDLTNGFKASAKAPSAVAPQAFNTFARRPVQKAPSLVEKYLKAKGAQPG